MIRPRIALACLATLYLVSCTGFLPPLVSWASFATPVTPTFNLAPTNAVVYGRFQLATHIGVAANDLALRLRNENSQKEHLIQFHYTDSVCGIAVEPGTYRVVGFVGTFFDHRTAGRRDLPRTAPFEVKPNALTYLGDFPGDADIKILRQEWVVQDPTNNFAATTAGFLKKCPNFTNATILSRYDSSPAPVASSSP